MQSATKFVVVHRLSFQHPRHLSWLRGVDMLWVVAEEKGNTVSSVVDGVVRQCIKPHIVVTDPEDQRNQPTQVFIERLENLVEVVPTVPTVPKCIVVGYVASQQNGIGVEGFQITGQLDCLVSHANVTTDCQPQSV